MNSIERLTAALTGDEVDRIPWSPNLAYWWESQDDSLVSAGEIEFLQSIGADPLIRGHYPLYDRNWEHIFLFDISYNGCEVRELDKGHEKCIVYETPLGTLKYPYRYSATGNTWFLSEYGVKSKKDFEILACLKERTVVTPNFEPWERLLSSFAGKALIYPMLSIDLKTAFQAMLEFWVGTEALVYALCDYPEAVRSALEPMREVNRRIAEISARSKALFFTTWEDSSTTNASPQYYAQHIAPEINEWCDILHNHGKFYIQHACGKLRAFLPIIAESRIDCIESISPPPTGDIELWEARDILPERIALIGGIEPTVFLQSSLEELEDYVSKLLVKMKGSRFILANSDSCPPGVSLEKFNLVSRLVRRLG